MASFSTVIPKGRKKKKSEYKQTIVLKGDFSFLIKNIPRRLTKLLLSPGENNRSENYHINLIKSRSKYSISNTKTTLNF